MTQRREESPHLLDVIIMAIQYRIAAKDYSRQE